MSKYGLLLSCMLLLTGCATPSINYQPLTIDVSEPPLNAVVTKHVGDEMLRQGKYREHDALQVEMQLKPVWSYTVYPGYFLKIGQDQVGDFYRIGGAGEESGYVEKSALADPYKSLLVKKDSGVLCVVTAFNVAACGSSTAGFQKIKKPIVSQDTIQRTLIYSGKVGNKINISYREFSGNTARPAFSNNVEYDISESKQIGYKGALVEVIEATNRSIQFKVISNFNAAAR